VLDGVLPLKAEMPHQNWTWIQPIPGQSKAAVTCGDGLSYSTRQAKPSFKLVGIRPTSEPPLGASSTRRTCTAGGGSPRIHR
jgi:hypothetical protein